MKDSLLLCRGEDVRQSSLVDRQMRSVAVIGCGTMGRAIVAGAVRAPAVDPARLGLASHSMVSAEALERDVGGCARPDNVAAHRFRAVPVVRAMPNTPCQIGKGMMVLTKGKYATDQHLAVAHEVFASVRRCIALDEKYMDVVTAVSASGAAFLYLVIEALSDGGVMCGPPRLAAHPIA